MELSLKTLKDRKKVAEHLRERAKDPGEDSYYQYGLFLIKNTPNALEKAAKLITRSGPSFYKIKPSDGSAQALTFYGSYQKNIEAIVRQLEIQREYMEPSQVIACERQLVILKNLRQAETIENLRRSLSIDLRNSIYYLNVETERLTRTRGAKLIEERKSKIEKLKKSFEQELDKFAQDDQELIENIYKYLIL